MNIWDQRIGANLKTLRAARGLTQEDLADRLNAWGHKFHQQTVLKVEKGQRPLKMREAMAIADVLKVSLERLVDDIETPEPSVYSHLAVTNNGVSQSICGKVWRRNPDAVSAGECPDCLSAASSVAGWVS